MAIEDRLNAVDAPVEWLAFRGGAGFVGAPEVGNVGPGFGADLDLVLVKDVASALAYRFNPAVYGEDACGCSAVGGDADGDQAGAGEKELAETGTVFVCRAADRGVEGGDELV